MTDTELTGWRATLPAALQPFVERGPLGAMLLGMASGFPIAMIGATLTTRRHIESGWAELRAAF